MSQLTSRRAPAPVAAPAPSEAVDAADALRDPLLTPADGITGPAPDAAAAPLQSPSAEQDAPSAASGRTIPIPSRYRADAFVRSTHARGRRSASLLQIDALLAAFERATGLEQQGEIARSVHRAAVGWLTTHPEAGPRASTIHGLANWAEGAAAQVGGAPPRRRRPLVGRRSGAPHASPTRRAHPAA